MGNCIGICNSNLLKAKGDIIIEKNSENETGKDLETQYLKKVIFLQKSIKKYLKKKKLKNNNNKGKNTQNTKKIKSSQQPKESIKDAKSSKKSLKIDKNNKYITYEEDQAE